MTFICCCVNQNGHSVPSHCFHVCRLASFAQTEGNISLSDVQTLVMDEADTLLDHSFYDQSSKLIKVLQYVCTSTRNHFISVAFAQRPFSLPA